MKHSCVKCRRPATREAVVSLIDGTVSHHFCDACLESFKTFMRQEGATHFKVTMSGEGEKS